MIDWLKDKFAPKASVPTIDVNALGAFNPAQTSYGASSIYDGNKFFGGLGLPTPMWTDYWSLRLWSAKLFQENPYARGLIRRLVTNEINTGLSLEATPIGSMVGLSEDQKNIWTEDVENRFAIWGKNRFICDFQKQLTFGALQRTIRREALLEGDILVVLRQSKRTGLPAIQLVPGSKIRSPLDGQARSGNKIVQGVELDKNGAQVAYWVVQDDGKGKRLPAFGERSGRRIAWLVYGTDKRFSTVRGEPMLSLILQSLKEIDRYRDSAQRKAVINSILAMFIKKTEDKPGTRPVTNGAIRRDQVSLPNPDGGTRTLDIAGQIPGMVIQELQTGEEPQSFGSEGTDVNFGPFEAAMLSAIAWAHEMPPEILTLSFQNNYSASRAAVNEFKLYLDKSRAERAEEFDAPVYEEWLISEVLRGKIKAPGLLEAWRNPLAYDVFGAWVLSDWAGAIKPSVDLKKEVQAYQIMVNAGFMTYARAVRELNGMKYSKVIKQLKLENTQKAEALTPLFELAQKFDVKPSEVLEASDKLSIEAVADEVMALVEADK